MQTNTLIDGQIKISYKNKNNIPIETSVSFSQLTEVVGYTTLCSISKLSKIHFIKDDYLHATILSDSIVGKCCIETSKNVWVDMLTGIAYVYCLGLLLNKRI